MELIIPYDKASEITAMTISRLKGDDFGLVSSDNVYVQGIAHNTAVFFMPLHKKYLDFLD
ncbi:hypothetical protein CL633_01690 [bacterium]|nr:hypothetical protein [bacterium]|tara:strand:- start:60 stop:239 length:180 start_codon:yes stop_codon:yes gene_type:complete